MRIALITDDYYPNIGGISNVLYNLHVQFLNKDPELYIFNPYLSSDYEFKAVKIKNFSLKLILKQKSFYYYLIFSIWSVIRDKKIPFSHRVKMVLYLFSRPREFLKIVENVAQLYKQLKSFKFDLIVSGNSGWIFPLTFILSRIFKKKLISIAYGNDFLVRNPLSLKTFYFRNLDKIVVITSEMKKLIKITHHLDNNQIQIIRVGVNLEDLELGDSIKDIRKEYNIPKDQYVLLSVGRHVPRKRFDLVIKAIKEIKELDPNINIRYYLIGEGKQTPYLKKLVKELDLENEVEFLGLCSLGKRNKFYKLSDLFLMPSITERSNIEAFGIVFLEANYFKKPVIGSNTGGMGEAIIDDTTGFLIEPDNLSDLVEKILFLYKHKEKGDQLGENGYRRVIAEFNWDKIVNEYINLFHAVLKSD